MRQELMQIPLMSVVMSVFNGGDFLREAVDSILGQSFTDFEFIIINDGSSDGSGAILEEYAKADSRVRVHHQQNRGLVEALNRGCALARGRYIARMDADDVAIADRLGRQVEFMETHAEIGVLGGAVEFIDTVGGILGASRNPSEDGEIRAALADDCPFWHSTVLMRTELLKSVGGYRKVVVDAEDCDLWLRLAERTRMANLDAVLVQYRFHPSQVTVRKARQQALSALAAHLAAERRAQGRPDPLDSVGAITPEVLVRLGVDRRTQEAAIASRHLWSIRNLTRTKQYAQALVLFNELLRDSIWKHVEPRVAADLHLLAARLYWHRGEISKSVVTAARAVRTRPVVLARPVKPLLRKLRAVAVQ